LNISLSNTPFPASKNQELALRRNANSFTGKGVKAIAPNKLKYILATWLC
jgi:hypothetical protein